MRTQQCNIPDDWSIGQAGVDSSPEWTAEGFWAYLSKKLSAKGTRYLIRCKSATRSTMGLTKLSVRCRACTPSYSQWIRVWEGRRDNSECNPQEVFSGVARSRVGVFSLRSTHCCSTLGSGRSQTCRCEQCETMRAAWRKHTGQE